MDDMISRSAAIDAIPHRIKGLGGESWMMTYRRSGYNDCVDACLDAIQHLPSAQPEKRTEKRTKTHACDCIERQAAIDAADRADYTGLAVEDVRKVTDEVVKELKQLPSAQQEQKGYWRHYEGYLTCSECGAEYYDDIMEYCGDDVPRFCPDCGADMRQNGGCGMSELSEMWTICHDCPYFEVCEPPYICAVTESKYREGEG